MSVTDSPDWQNVVTIRSGGTVTDAPDWSEVVTGPGGTPVGPTPGGGPYTIYFNLGFKAITLDPMAAQSSVGRPAGRIDMTMFSPFVTFSCTQVTWPTYLGSAVTANQNFIGIYDTGQHTAGTATLLAQTAVGACDTPFATTGTHTLPFTSSVTLTAGQNYYITPLNNGGTPGFVNGSADNPYSLNPLGLAPPVVAFLNGPNTTLPATVLISSLTSLTDVFLFYLN